MEIIPNSLSVKQFKRKVIDFKEREIEGNFVKTNQARERIQKIDNFLDSDIPIVLEGDTGTSKTKSVEVYCFIKKKKMIRFNLSSETTIEDLMGRLISQNDSWSGFKFVSGPFIDAYTNGYILLLDEVNLVQKNIIQSLQYGLDSEEIYIESTGGKIIKFKKSKNFRIICTQNPKSGGFTAIREDLSEFLQRFQIINFDRFSVQELKEIAILIHKKKGISDKNIVEQIGNFHYDWTESKNSKKSPQCFTIRDLSSTISSLNNITPSKSIYCFYGSRYEINERNLMKNLLKQNFQMLYQEEYFPNLPNNFPKCFPSESVKRAYYYSKIAFENRRHVIFTGRQGIGLTQISKWIALNTSKDKNNIFCFIFTPETTLSDLFGGYIPNTKTDTGAEITIWREGILSQTVQGVNFGIFLNIHSAPSKILERLNPLLEPKDTFENEFFDIPENTKNKQIPISDNFHFIGTCDIKYLNQVSPAFLNRVTLINLDDQIKNLNYSQIIEFIKIIIFNEKIENIPECFYDEFYGIYENIKENLNLSHFALLIKSCIRLYDTFKTNNIKDLVNYINNILEKKKNINIPQEILNRFKELYKNSDTKEKFYFKNSPNLENLMANLYVCYICRLPVVLVGPTGVGKTSMARALSEIINKDKTNPFIMFCFNIETQVSDLYGTLTLEQGIPKSVKGPLYKAFEEGNIFIADEFNLAEDSILQSVSIVLESSDIGSNTLIPGLGCIATYNPSFFFIACQNDIQTKGRRLLPDIISKRLIMFEYPEPKESDIEASCRDIATYELLKDCENELKESFPIKISRFMFLLNKKREPEIGEWSMRNIRKLYRRIKLHKIKIESKEFINITYIHQIVFYILQSIKPDKRSEILDIILDLIKQSFYISDEEKEEIKECIQSTPQLKKFDNSQYLIKGKNGIKISKIIENKLNGFDNLKAFLESLFYCLLCDINEHLLFLGLLVIKHFYLDYYCQIIHLLLIYIMRLL